eukprot:scaffold1394_cov109-Isochrysis_galbana.AAC.5
MSGVLTPHPSSRRAHAPSRARNAAAGKAQRNSRRPLIDTLERTSVHPIRRWAGTPLLPAAGGRRPATQATPNSPSFSRHGVAKWRQQRTKRATHPNNIANISTTARVRHRTQLPLLRRFRLPPERWRLLHWATKDRREGVEGRKQSAIIGSVRHVGVNEVLVNITPWCERWRARGQGGPRQDRSIFNIIGNW